MSTTGLATFDTTIRKTNSWLKDVCRELGYGNRHEAYRVLKATLQALRDLLTPEESANLVAQLPMLVRGFYFAGWQPNKSRPAVRHEQGFLNLVKEHYGEGQLDPRLGACAVFKVLAERVSAGEVEDIKGVLPKEIRGLWPQEGCAAVYMGDDPHEDALAKPVSEFMTRGVMWAAPDRPLQNVLERMNEERLRHVLVVAPAAIVDGVRIPYRAVVGILTSRDLLRELQAHPDEGVRLTHLTVREVMTEKPLVTIEPNASLAEAGALMRSKRISALPVFSNELLVGLITTDDLLNAGALVLEKA